MREVRANPPSPPRKDIPAPPLWLWLWLVCVVGRRGWDSPAPPVVVAVVGGLHTTNRCFDILYCSLKTNRRCA